MADGPEEVTISEGARRLGMSAVACGVWAKKPGAPITRVDGKVRLQWPAFPKWWGDQREEGGKRAAKPQSLNEARNRRDMAEAELKEYELAQMRGELLTVDDNARLVSDAYGRVASKLNGLRRQIPLRVTGGTMVEREQQVNPLIDEVMAELAEGKDVPTGGEEAA